MFINSEISDVSFCLIVLGKKFTLIYFFQNYENRKTLLFVDNLILLLFMPISTLKLKMEPVELFSQDRHFPYFLAISPFLCEVRKKVQEPKFFLCFLPTLITIGRIIKKSLLLYSLLTVEIFSCR